MHMTDSSEWMNPSAPEKRLKKIRAPRAPPAGPSGGRPGRGLGWGLVCFAEVLLVVEDSLGPAPPVCTRAGLTRARSLNTWFIRNETRSKTDLPE